MKLPFARLVRARIGECPDGEYFAEGLRFGIAEHAFDLRLKNFGFMQLFGKREVAEFFVGHRRP